MTKEFTGTLEFTSPINRETSFGSRPLADNAKSEISITINNDGTGVAEWEGPELDEYERIGLSFTGNELVDYDGVFSLPQELITYLTQQGYDMTWAE
jgi:hypothetical protein